VKTYAAQIDGQEFTVRARTAHYTLCVVVWSEDQGRWLLLNWARDLSQAQRINNRAHNAALRECRNCRTDILTAVQL
jgi:hypothetical protein